MPVRMILAASALLLSASPLAAQDCQSLDQSGRAERIRKASTCDKAMATFGDCAYGAGGDTELGGIVTEKCEAMFLQELSRSQKSAYDRGIKECNEEYKNEDGTMYRAMEAGCRADLAQTFARKFGKQR